MNINKLTTVYNNEGFTIIELVASVLLAALVFFMMTLTIVNFFNTFQEMRDLTELQDETMNALQIIRYGYIDKFMSDQVIGLNSANVVQISQAQNYITIKPVQKNTGMPYYLTYSTDARGRLIVSGQYGNYSVSPKAIFPRDETKIGRDLKYRVASVTFQNVTPGTTPHPALVRITLKTQVRFRQRDKTESIQDDVERNIRTVNYSTVVFVSNYAID